MMDEGFPNNNNLEAQNKDNAIDSLKLGDKLFKGRQIHKKDLKIKLRLKGLLTLFDVIFKREKTRFISKHYISLKVKLQEH